MTPRLVPTLNQRVSTARAGTKVDGGAFTLGGKTIRPYSDCLPHDVGTGDGIVMALTEHYRKNVCNIYWKGAVMQIGAADSKRDSHSIAVGVGCGRGWM